MLSASEAKKKTQDSINDRVTKELDKLNKQIDKAIARGSFSISNDGILQSETSKRLESLGYRVQTGSQYNESYYNISWS